MYLGRNIIEVGVCDRGYSSHDSKEVEIKEREKQTEAERDRERDRETERERESKREHIGPRIRYSSPKHYASFLFPPTSPLVKIFITSQ
jgi:hypothetical protein